MIRILTAAAILASVVASSAEAQTYRARMPLRGLRTAASTAPTPSYTCGTLTNPRWTASGSPVKVMENVGSGSANMARAQSACAAYAATATAPGICAWDISNGNMFWYLFNNYRYDTPYGYATTCN